VGISEIFFGVSLVNTSYSVEWGEYSRLEILVGKDLKDEFGLGHRERLRLEVRGDPNWKEYEKQGRLELFYDEQAQTFRAFQPVTVDDSRLAQPLASEEAVTRNLRFLVAHQT
jgi:putative transposase